jgi:hypothetical protein
MPLDMPLDMPRNSPQKTTASQLTRLLKSSSPGGSVSGYLIDLLTKVNETKFFIHPP